MTAGLRVLTVLCTGLLLSACITDGEEDVDDEETALASQEAKCKDTCPPPKPAKVPRDQKRKVPPGPVVIVDKKPRS